MIKDEFNTFASMLLIFFILLSVLIGIEGYQSYIFQKTTQENQEIIYNAVTQQLTDDQIQHIIAQRFADVHHYNLTDYNCKNYSKDYAIVMNLLGYETYVFYNYNQTHAYDLQAIEPQTAEYRVFKIQ